MQYEVGYDLYSKANPSKATSIEYQLKDLNVKIDIGGNFIVGDWYIFDSMRFKDSSDYKEHYWMFPLKDIFWW
jgi:hypothetical protein